MNSYLFFFLFLSFKIRKGLEEVEGIWGNWIDFKEWRLLLFIETISIELFEVLFWLLLEYCRRKIYWECVRIFNKKIN